MLPASLAGPSCKMLAHLCTNKQKNEVKLSEAGGFPLDVRAYLPMRELAVAGGALAVPYFMDLDDMETRRPFN
jgi:hypothetical protein